LLLITDLWWLFQFSVLILPLFPAAGAVGLLLVMAGIWRDRWDKIISYPLNWGWAVFGAWLIINSFFAVYPEEAWLGLANFLPFLALSAALSQLIKYPSQLRRLSWLLVLPSLPIVILGMGQLWLNWATPDWLAAILGWQLVPQGEPPGRMSSVFIYTNFLAIYLAIAVTLAAGILIGQKKQNWVWFLLITIIVVDSLGLVLTSSRNAWGIAFLSFMAFALYLGWRWLVYAITAATTAILWASFLPDFGGKWWRKIVPAFLWGRLSDQMYPDRPVETLRITQWRFCWNLIQERPLIGWGLRNFTPLYQAEMNVWFGHPHSLFIMLATEIGIPATLLLAALVAWVMAKAILLLKSDFNEVRGSSVVLRRSLSDQRDRPILFSYLVAFTGCILFNLVDVTIFDLRVNLITWILFSGINGMVLRSTNYDQ
jgi:O-antigen ligase